MPLDALFAQASSSLEGRILATVLGVVLGLVAVGAVRVLQRRVADRSRPLLADVLASVFLVGVVLALAAGIVRVWGQTDAILTLASEFDVGGATVARLTVSFIVVVGTYILTRFVHRLLADVIRSAVSVSDHQRKVTFRIAQVILWSVALVVILGIWVDDLSGIFIGAGVLGIILGMAARQTLGAMLAGFVIMVSRPFEVGDWIAVADHEGVVTDIALVDTRLQSLDGESVVVPNDVISSAPLVNKSRHGRLRIEIEVGVDYETDLATARSTATEAVGSLDGILESPEPAALTTDFEDSAIVLTVRAWTDASSAREYWTVQSRVVSAIVDAFEEAGISIPYPQRVLSNRPEDMTDEPAEPTLEDQ